MYCQWKDNWLESKENYARWWKRSGLVVSNWGSRIPLDRELFPAADPGEPASLEQKYADPDWIALKENAKMARSLYPMDMIPIAFPDIGTVSLAPMLGAEPDFGESNIWYRHDSGFGPENDRPLVFDPENRWWKIISESARRVKETGGPNYFTGLPAVCPNLDALAEIRGTENLMMDLILAPDWVKAKLEEIHTAFLQAFGGLYDIIKEEDGSSVMGYFMTWSPGRVCLAQCDTVAMISADMFEEFVIPPLEKQCAAQDNTIYHVDGPMALKSVDALLKVEGIDAIEYTPGPNVPGGGDPHWFDLYRRIKEAGKSVQVVEVEPAELAPLLEAIGTEGTFVQVKCFDEETLKGVEETVRKYR